MKSHAIGSQLSINGSTSSTITFPQSDDWQELDEKLGFYLRCAIMEYIREKEHKSFLANMEFISTISQKLAIKPLLPIKTADLADQPPAGFDSEYIFEPEANSIFEALLPQYVELQLYHTLLESLASEHSARMVAMKNAHDNAIEVVDQLTLEYNQARQGRITGELLDVISSRMVLE